MCEIDYIKQQEIIEKLSELNNEAETNENIGSIIAKVKKYIHSIPILRKQYKNNINKFELLRQDDKISKNIKKFFKFILLYAKTTSMYSKKYMDDVALDLYYPECIKYMQMQIPNSSKKMLEPKFQDGVLNYYFANVTYYDTNNLAKYIHANEYKKGFKTYFKLKYKSDFEYLADYYLLEHRTKDANHYDRIPKSKEHLYRVVMLTVIKDLREYINNLEALDIPIEETNKLQKQSGGRRTIVKLPGEYDYIKNSRKFLVYFGTKNIMYYFSNKEYQLLSYLADACIKDFCLISTKNKNTKSYVSSINKVVRELLKTDKRFIVPTTNNLYSFNEKAFIVRNNYEKK